MSALTAERLKCWRHGKFREIGCIYAATSADGEWIKVGFSSRIGGRLAALDHAYPQYAPFRIIGICRSTWRAEQQFHRALRGLHASDCCEIYPAIPPIKEAVEAFVHGEHRPAFEFDEYWELREWAKRISAHLKREKAA